MKIIFMGTPDFAQKSLEAIYNAKHEIQAVVTNPDRPKGRGMKMIATPVKEYAESKNIKIYQPEKIRNNEEFIKQIKDLKPDVICVVAYGKILPKEILEIPKYGCINVHGSLLPKYRGAAPIQWAVINGEKVTGVTTMYMDIGMDTGDMILKSETKIGEDETTGELWDRLSIMGADLLVETLNKIQEGTAPREKQSEEFSMAPMLDKQIAEINFNTKTAEEIKNLVRGLNPIMGAFTFFEGKKVKIWKVEVLKQDEFKEKYNYKKTLENQKLGEILIADSKKGLFVNAKNGILEILEVQGENAKRMTIYDYLRGNNITVQS